MSPRVPVSILAGCIAAVSAAVAAPRPTPRTRSADPAPVVQYNRDVRPILSDNCFQCHGPDEKKRAAGLRLDLRESALARNAIVPGKTAESRLVARIMEPDPARRMPPASSHRTLTAAQKETLRRWIAQGARYERHWAFVPLPDRVPVPAGDQKWARNEIDRFVSDRLARARLKPSPPAGREEWLRRVTLDLTGLPPTPAEQDAFLADRSPTAFETVVDRLLASPRYGQRMAVPWLDAARYADSYGYQSDQLSPTWPYRDWVIDAFNRDLPYDRFLTWQLAGDILPAAGREQRLATAFNRLHRMTNEGGSVPEEWRLEGVADRVHTFSTAVLGLTMECARCHDHKFDPISQRDYYSLSAFFNSIDEHGLYDRADIVPTPSLLLPSPEQERRLAEARRRADEARSAWAAAAEAAEPEFQSWLASVERAPVAAPQPDHLPDQIGYFDFETIELTMIPNRLPGSRQEARRADELPLVPGRFGKAALLDGENNVNLPGTPFTRHTPFTVSFWMRDPRRAAEPAVVFHASGGTDTGPHGYDLLLEKGTLTARLFRHWPGNAVAVRTGPVVPPNAWTHVCVTYDGSSTAAGLRIYVDGAEKPVQVVRDRLYKGIGQYALTFGQRFRDRGFQGGQLDEVRLFTRDLSPLEVAHLAGKPDLSQALSEPRRHAAELRRYYQSARSEELRRLAAALTTARQAVWQAEDPILEVAVMEEMPEPRPAYVLARGAYDAPRSDANRVNRAVPASILPWPAGAPRDRTGLARWVTDPRHPLTARVAVNRVWQMLWGRGLVESAENFGLQGSLPSHPELLDWLARDLIRSGWSLKGLVRKIVLSATYRQTSSLTPALLKRDPSNLLLARGPSHRLDAETIRDSVLFASGLLDERHGGPPVSPYQPGDLWRESNVMSPPYRQSVGRDLYRRSVYSVWKRTAPLPNMLAFDAGSREVCLARRSTTSTPLQALVLLNDPQFVEAARALGERMLVEGGASDEERVRFAFRAAAGRRPTAEEQSLLVRLYRLQREEYARDPTVAARLLTVGEKKPAPNLPPVELAAAAAVGQCILNLDAVIWKR